MKTIRTDKGPDDKYCEITQDIKESMNRLTSESLEAIGSEAGRRSILLQGKNLSTNS